MYTNKNKLALADPHVLVAEDDWYMLQLIESFLKADGYNVDTCEDGGTALQKLTEGGPYDIALLDSVMPKMSGLKVLETIRRAGMHIPVIIVSGQAQESHRVEGLSIGADDYITKPFSSRELLARILAIRRRVEAHRKLPKQIRVGETLIDFEAREALSGDGMPIHFTPTEWAMLLHMAHQNGAAISRSEFKIKVLKIPAFINTRTTDRHAYSLRCKLDQDSRNPHHILTVVGVGYRLNDFEILA